MIIAYDRILEKNGRKILKHETVYQVFDLIKKLNMEKDVLDKDRVDYYRNVAGKKK